MSTPVRKKRNFKGLGLDVAAAPEPEPAPMPMPTRAAPTAGKKRPPAMVLKAPKLPSSTMSPSNDKGASLAEGLEKGLVLDSGVPPASALDNAVSPDVSHKRMTYHTALSHTLATLDNNAEKKFELKSNSDLRDMHELGQGNGGSVKMVEHVPTGTIMAKKVNTSLVTLQMDADLYLRLSSSMPNLQYESRSSVNCRSCTTVTRPTSSTSTERS
jgi:mitogen-activated protein kinase kinase